ncbi:uncharacterized protein LOC136036473 [Artemia franciscana]|uniref:Fatty acid hydroxylase domain-containing protein n=1 Tax=Artemia franciscana TaxID=6661 RepID=A0AA88IFH7_ARTSF|nr:hypothetical protein QYM36_004023 [Artemia franciscana]
MKTVIQQEYPKVEKEFPNDPFAPKWIEKYSETLDKVWAKIPRFLGTFIVSFAVFTFGATLRGEWMLFLAFFLRYRNEDKNETMNIIDNDEFSLEHFHLKDLGFYCTITTIVSYITFFGVGGFLHWYYYVRQRDRAEEWKCQPQKWLPPELERHEITLGSVSLFIGSIISGIIACWVINGGWSTVYFKIEDYGWLWYILQYPVAFVMVDYVTYWFHRTYHTPFLYKNFHKMHHYYKQPTAFSVTAIHPVEFVNMQFVQILPMYTMPVHWTTMCILLSYIYYHGIIDHSGINFKAHWWQPWQPDCIFHDNHHQYFHVNFGFNIFFWDKLHGTYRQKDRIYREDIFYGKGKAVTEATHDELKEDIAERTSENPLAYRGDKREFDLDDSLMNDKKRE